ATEAARLWATRLQVSSEPVELARANTPGVMDGGAVNLANSYPRWYPLVTRGAASSTRLVWVTFASSRMYGLRQTPMSLGGENPRGSLLWVAAVDPDKLAAGVDPSYPAFALPFQNVTASQHLPQWVMYAVSNGCSTAGESCGGGGSSCCNGLQCVRGDAD